MPAVSALVWKNLLMKSVSGPVRVAHQSLGFAAVDWFTQLADLSIILIVSCEWLPFASLILLTALQSFDEEQKEAATSTAPRRCRSSFIWFAAHCPRGHRRYPDRDDLPAERFR